MTLEKEAGDDAESPIVWVHIRLTKTMVRFPPFAVATWMFAKRLLFVLGVLGVIYALVAPRQLEPSTIRYVLVALLAWLLWDQIVAPKGYGKSHILVTTRGVVFTEHNLYLDWDDIANYQLSPELLRLEPKPGRGPGALFGKRRLDIPVTPRNREILRDLFAENVERWKPA
ncbi:MAG: hypothetical protein R3F20_04900 [Planctomycetota bacterium]